MYNPPSGSPIYNYMDLHARVLDNTRGYQLLLERRISPSDRTGRMIGLTRVLSLICRFLKKIY